MDATVPPPDAGAGDLGAPPGDAAGAETRPPDAGASQRPDARSPNATAGPVSYTTFARLIRDACSGCHTPEARHRVDLSERGLHARLVNARPTRGAAARRSQILIVPGQPAASLLYNETLGTNLGGCGKRMPALCEETDTCLAPEQVKLIQDWISQGARP